MIPIYLDYNASTPLRSQAKDAMVQAMDCMGNASSIHKYGRTVRQHLETSRQSIADYFQTPPSRVIFTSGATEANNLALKGFKGTVITQASEHDSVLLARPDALICPIDDQGIIKLDQLDLLLKGCDNPALVSCMAANNETGVIQPLAAISSLCKAHNAWFHCDAVQVIGKLDLDWQDIACDMISLSAHKIGGPSGVGALIIHEKLPLFPMMRGGGQERSFRAGTENVLGIIGFGAAIAACQKDDWTSIATFRDKIEKELCSIDPCVRIFGAKVQRLANTTNITMPGVKNTVQLMNFDLAGIAVSAGSACSSGKVKSSHVLAAMNIDDNEAESSIRISLGWKTTAQEVSRFITAWQEMYHRLGPPSERMSAS